MKQPKNPHQLIKQFVLANRGVFGTPELFALATGLDKETAQIVLWDLGRGANPVVREKPVGSGIWAYNPDHRHDRSEPLMAPRASFAIARA